MKWFERPTDKFLKCLLVISLFVSIGCNVTILYLFSKSGSSLMEYFQVMFSLDVPFIREYLNSFQTSDTRIWITLLYGVDYVFFVALGLMMYSASLLIYRNEKAFGPASKFGKLFALLGLATIAIDFIESNLVIYMFSNARTYPDWVVIPHSLLFILAIVVDGIIGLFLLMSLLIFIIRTSKSMA